MPTQSRTSTLLVWAGNILLGVLLSFSFLERVSPADNFGIALFGILSLIASIGILSLLPGIIGLIVQVRLSGKKRNWSIAFIWTLSLWVLFIDTRLHGFYGFHINRTVMEALFTPGIDESVSIGLSDILPLLLLGASLLPAQAWFAARKVGKHERLWSLTIILGSLLSFLVLQFWEANLPEESRGPISERIDAAPIPLSKEPISRFIEKLNEGVMGELPTPSIPSATNGDQGPPTNILVLTLDCLRMDAIDSETAPNISKFRNNALSFNNHISGGNWTQHGVFSLLYGIHGSYWQPCLRSKTPPPLILALQDAGYAFQINAAAAQTFPAFRSTCWVSINKDVNDQFTERTPAERDRQSVVAFDEWLKELPKEQAFFSFFLLDASHQAYSFPPEDAVFTPYQEEIRYVPISYGTTEEERKLIKARYRNAVHFSDRTVALILETLEKHHVAENTIVVITGDHGEEFWEHQIWGHATNFSREQTQVPFLISGPGIPKGVIDKPSSHIDFAPSILELLGVSPSLRPTYSLGENLLSLPADRYRITTGWQGLGVRVNENILFLPTPQGGRAAAYDLDWNRVSNTQSILQLNSEVLDDVLAECQQFLEPKL